MGLISVDGHYDREGDIAWLCFEGWDKDRVRTEETDHGLIERDRSTDQVLGLEFWGASKRLPAELLEALPAPPAREIVIKRHLADDPTGS